MRYRGQGHEITVSLPLEDLTASADSRPGDHVVQRTLESRFVESYRELYTRDIPGLEVEALTWLLTVRTVLPDLEWAQPPSLATDSDGTFVEVVDPATGRSTPHLVFDRGAIGEVPVAGPALVTEDQTTTVVPDGFGVRRGPGGHLLVARMPIDPEEIR